jgi:type II secretory pathway component PulF
MKKAKEFAQKTAGETFSLEEAQKGEKKTAQEAALEQQEKIVLNIGRSKKKIGLLKQTGGEETGNFFIDTFHKINNLIISLNRVKVQEKAVFFRLLAVMVDAGIPIIRSLHTLADQNKKNLKFARIITDMAFRIEEGESFSLYIIHRPFPDDDDGYPSAYSIIHSNRKRVTPDYQGSCSN